MFAVHSVGTGAFSSSLFMKQLRSFPRGVAAMDSEDGNPAGIRQQVGHLVEHEEGISAARQQALGEREFAEPFGTTRLVAPLVALADAVQGYAELRRHGPAELGLSGPGWSVKENVDAGLPGPQRPPEEVLGVIPVLSDVIEVGPFELRPVRLAEENVPDLEVLAGQIGQPDQTFDEREVAVIVDRYETRSHEWRLGHEAHGNRPMRHVEKTGERRVPYVEVVPALPAHEHVVDHRFDDRVGLVEQQNLQDSDVRGRDPR